MRSEDLEFEFEFKDMLKLSWEALRGLRQLRFIDDAFHLSWEKVAEVKFILRDSQMWRLTDLEEYMNWDKYVRAFCLKMLSCPPNIPPFSYKSLKELGEDHIPLSKRLPQRPIIPVPEKRETDGFVRRCLRGPFKFGYYSPGKAPDRIPYHLFLLVKQVDDIMRCSQWDGDGLKDLPIVEKKIWFFCNYFHSHLPRGWKYNRDNASEVVDSYNPLREPKYNMAGYTPISSFSDPGVEFEYVEGTNLSRHDMIAIMCIIHSRVTPTVWKMTPHEILFYCKMCSCFGIDYHRLEDASEDDVCLMNVGLHP